MILAELINAEGGIAPVTLGLLTTIIGVVGIIAKGVFDARAKVEEVRKQAQKATESADKATESADKAFANTAPISNGFADSVLRKLDRIDGRMEALDSSVRQHLEWHVNNPPQKG